MLVEGLSKVNFFNRISIRKMNITVNIFSRFRSGITIIEDTLNLVLRCMLNGLLGPSSSSREMRTSTQQMKDA